MKDLCEMCGKYLGEEPYAISIGKFSFCSETCKMDFEEEQNLTFNPAPKQDWIGDSLIFTKGNHQE